MLLFSSYCIFNLILTVALLLSCFVDCIWLPWLCWGSKGTHRSASVAMAVGYCFNCPTFLPSIDGCLDWACLCGGLCEMFMFMFMFDWACLCLIEMLIGHPLRTPEVGPSWAWQTLSGRILVRWHQRLAPEDRQLLHGSWSRWKKAPPSEATAITEEAATGSTGNKVTWLKNVVAVTVVTLFLIVLLWLIGLGQAWRDVASCLVLLGPSQSWWWSLRCDWAALSAEHDEVA